MSWTQILSKHDLVWIFKDIWYRLDWRKPNVSSIKKFLVLNISLTAKLTSLKTIPIFSTMNYDEKVYNIENWVKKNISYEIDSKRFNVVEKWQTVEETVAFNKGDCEDMSIMIYSIARINGISPAQIRLVCGDVVMPDDSITGHCWVEYKSDEDFQWKVLDACFYPTKKSIKEREAKCLLTYYKKDWFVVTDFLA